MHYRYVSSYAQCTVRYTVVGETLLSEFKTPTISVMGELTLGASSEDSIYINSLAKHSKFGVITAC